ncbi:MAG: hypothetical protein KGV59_07000 [Tenacibaculum sp.]|nr:hypothetical protein [Tenacibaculum sp.]
MMTIIFPWLNNSWTDWGKQITIIYDRKDILVNCISFGRGSIPSPLHWFANKRKINKLKSGFEDGIKNILQNNR